MTENQEKQHICFSCHIWFHGNRTSAATRRVPFGSRYTKNAFVAQALPWTALGQLSAPTDP